MKENRGQLRPNPDKRRAGRQPDYVGECDIDGRKVRAAAWISKGGIYLAFGDYQPSDHRQSPPERATATIENEPELFPPADESSARSDPIATARALAIDRPPPENPISDEIVFDPTELPF